MKLSDNQKRALGTILRAALLLAFNPLVKHHFIDVNVLGPALDDLVEQGVGWLVSGGVLVWSFAQKWIDQQKIAIAAALPTGSTAQDVNDVLKATNPGLTKVP